MQNTLEQKTMQLVHGLAAQKEALIRAAIDYCIGGNWTLAEITGRGTFKVLPDKTEIFNFDGKDLIHFFHTRTEVDNTIRGIYMRAVTDYRLLY